MKFTWITQGGFIFENGSFRLAVDPYISDFIEKNRKVTRIVPPVFTVATLSPNAVFCTHDHIDHFDPIAIPEIAQKFPDCIFVGPSSVGKKAKESGITESRIVNATKGISIKLGPFEIIPVVAFHSDKDAVGIIIKCQGKKFYISGDSEYSAAIAADVLKYGGFIDIMFICINGRLGNMNFSDALKIVEAVKPDIALPMHYDLFKENSIDPCSFIEKCNDMGIKSFEMKQGQVYPIYLKELLKTSPQGEGYETD